jgi:outer membrane protein assembly factor BamD (BamD/ComL family)
VKHEKPVRPSGKTKRGTTSTPSRRISKPTAPTSESNLSIGGNVKNAIVMVFSGTLFSGNWIAKRIRKYRAQPSQLLFDASFLCIWSAVILGLVFLFFVFVYYGSSSKVFSNTSSLLLFPKMESWVIKLLYVGGTIYLAVALFRLLKGYGIRTIFFSFLFISILAISAFSLVKGATKRKFQLIDLNYENALSRADEFVSNGQFELAKEILLRYPAKDRVPSYALNTKVKRSKPSEESASRGSAVTDPALETLRQVVRDLYDSGNYQEIIRTACRLSNTNLWPETLLDWRSAAYVMSHDPVWGPENTLNWINEINNQFPECRKIASPFWLAIPPELASLIQDSNWEFGRGQLGPLYSYYGYLPFSDSITKTLPDANIRDICKDEPSEDLSKVNLPTYYTYQWCEYDMRLVEDYLQRYPEDLYADYGKFILGNLDQIILEGYEGNQNIYDFAYYEKGWREYQQGDYEAALKTFQGFLFIERFSNHPWRDDARWRAAMCYKHLGKYIDALQYLSRMESEVDGDVPYYADMPTHALYIADVLMPLNDLISVVSENLFPNLQPILQYTLAERLLAEGYYPGSRELFVKIGNQYKGQVFTSSEGIEYSYSEFSDQKVKVIDVLTNYQKEHPHDVNLFIAEYLETYDSFSPLENELRQYFAMFGDDERQITSEYLVKRSKNYVAAKLRQQYLDENPLDPKAPDLLLKIAQGYETVSSWADLPADDFISIVRQKASDSYLMYLDRFFGLDSNITDMVMEHAGSLYMTRCDYDSFFRCDLESIRGMRNIYSQLVSKYPNHRLANNFLNWIAWSYCYEANVQGISDEQYVEAYQLALATYHRITVEYPDGIIGENARNNIPIIEAKLLNPAVRVPPDNWGWPIPK